MIYVHGKIASIVDCDGINRVTASPMETDSGVETMDVDDSQVHSRSSSAGKRKQVAFTAS